jgi:hypothetical protein
LQTRVFVPVLFATPSCFEPTSGEIDVASRRDLKVILGIEATCSVGNVVGSVNVKRE